MKSNVSVLKLVFFYLLLANVATFAQNIPSAVNFQAVARNASNQIVANTTIEARITITQGNGGPVIRTLTFQKTTDAYGQFSLSLSEGDASASSGPTPFNNIDWASGDKWLRVEYRPNLVDGFTLISNTQASASFYAFAARTAEELKTTGANGQVLKHNGTTWVAGADEGSTFTAPTKQIFTSGSGTYTTPVGVKYIRVRGCGGGGGGGTLVGGYGGGGGGGGCFERIIVNPPATVSYSIGAGGGAASAGGNTIFGAFCTGNGGSGGVSNTGPAGTGGNATGGDINARGNGGTMGYAASGFGGPGSGGGSAFFGGGAANGLVTSNGATNTGGGGNGNGGSGGSGIIIVEEYYQ